MIITKHASVSWQRAEAPGTWSRTRVAQEERRHVVAEVVLFDYWQGLLDHGIAKEALCQVGYTEQQAVRMLRRVSRPVDKR